MQKEFAWILLSVILGIMLALVTCGSFDSEKNIPKLIDSMISPNPAPMIHAPKAQYPEGFDRSAQQKTMAAFRELYDWGPRSFPQLFDHLENDHYSLTEDTGNSEHNFSVGHLCRLIMSCHLEPWERYRRTSGPRYFRHFKLDESQSARDWWKSRKHQSLRQLQREILKWTIAEQEKNPTAVDPNDTIYIRQRLSELEASSSALEPSWPFAK